MSSEPKGPHGHKLGCPAGLYFVASELRSLIPLTGPRMSPRTADALERAKPALLAFYQCTCEKDFSNVLPSAPPPCAVCGKNPYFTGAIEETCWCEP
jgi:hypothetical protein